MLGKTNTVSQSGGSGTTVTAINKTGKAIAKGDKVWLNSNAKIAGNRYKIKTDTTTTVMSRTGNFAADGSALYNLGADAATKIGSFSYGPNGILKYLPDNSLFVYKTRVDDNAQYTTSFVNLLGENYAYTGISGDSKIHQFNISDGSVIQTWTSTNKSAYLSTEGVKVGNYFYRLNSSAKYKCHLGDDATIVVDGNFTYDNPFSYSLYPSGVTADNKYIICNTSTSNNEYLRIVEVINDSHLKCLTQSEMPADLQEFYSAKCCIAFNPYTGIFTVAAYKGTSYAVMKYSNGAWTKLSVNLGDELVFWAQITVSDDLSRACANTSTGAYAINLSTTSGFAAMPYRFYTNSEDTITGYAEEAAEAGASFNVLTASEVGA